MREINGISMDRVSLYMHVLFDLANKDMVMTKYDITKRHEKQRHFYDHNHWVSYNSLLPPKME